jgi:hypothetical protein
MDPQAPDHPKQPRAHDEPSSSGRRHSPPTSARQPASRTAPSRSGLSPILIPGEPTTSTSGRVRRWVGELLGGSKKAKPRRVPGAAAGKGVADSDHAGTRGTGARTLSGTDPLDGADPVLATDQPVQRATTQLLPGRLLPLNPGVIEQEVRFFRADTPRNTQTVTLGWDVGAPPEHVTLDHPSIQPLHARMTYEMGQWMIETLSDQDPVEINGSLLLAEGVPYLLSNEDQIRIGKALFRFLLP